MRCEAVLIALHADVMLLHRFTYVCQSSQIVSLSFGWCMLCAPFLRSKAGDCARNTESHGDCCMHVWYARHALSDHAHDSKSVNFVSLHMTAYFATVPHGQHQSSAAWSTTCYANDVIHLENLSWFTPCPRSLRQPQLQQVGCDFGPGRTS